MISNTRESGFAGLGLGPKLLSALDRAGLKDPTPIQQQAIPAAVEGRDLVGLAQTGTGKTLAFLLPIGETFADPKAGCALILAPTRELALQIQEVAEQMLRPLGLNSTVLIGGASMRRQIDDLRRHPRIVIATPGRLEDHLASHTYTLDRVSIVVLDEADRMLDMGFLPAVRRIFSRLPERRQTMLFSATMPAELASLSTSSLRDAVRIEVARPGTPIEAITQSLINTGHGEKPDKLDEVLRAHEGSVLIFARTRHGARKVAKMVHSFGHRVSEIHSDRTQAQRKMALEGFKNGNYRVLVATDIAARGIDVKNIGLVLNYDLPDNPEDYVHRIGRTGRAGESGMAITFVGPDQAKTVRAIEKLLGAPIGGRRSDESHRSVHDELRGPRVASRRRRPHGFSNHGASTLVAQPAGQRH
jgi:ATP-dependent RNA helicase RhlE